MSEAVDRGERRVPRKIETRVVTAGALTLDPASQSRSRTSTADRNGLVLARALAAYTPDCARGLAAYEAARRERTSRLVAGATENVKRLTNPILADPATAQVFLDAEFAEAKMSERLNWVYEYDATSVVV